MSKLIAWLKAHKALLGAIVSFVAAGLKGTGKDNAAAIVAMAGTALLGAGALPSDPAVKKFGDEAK